MAKHLDLDDVCAGNLKALEELAGLRAKVSALEQVAERYLDALTRISQVPPDTCTTAYDMRRIANKTIDAAMKEGQK